jgi:hypothetical protein
MQMTCSMGTNSKPDATAVGAAELITLPLSPPIALTFQADVSPAGGDSKIPSAG